MDSKIQHGVCRGWGCTHGSAVKLLPVGVVKLEDVIAHKKLKGVKKKVSAMAYRFDDWAFFE